MSTEVMPVRTLRRDGIAYVRINDVVAWLLWEQIARPENDLERTANTVLSALAAKASEWERL